MALVSLKVTTPNQIAGGGQAVAPTVQSARVTVPQAIGLTLLAGGVGPSGATGPPGVGASWKGLWSSGTTYAIGDGVQGSDGHNYISVVGSNLNHNPVGDAGVHWSDLLPSTVVSVSSGAGAAFGAELGAIFVSGLVGGATDNTATVQAAVNALDATYGGKLVFPQGKWYVKGPVTLPRLGTGEQGQIHLDLGSCTLWTDQGNPIFQCLVGAGSATTLIEGCVDWEIFNGHLLSSNHAAGSRGVRIEASYNLRYRGIHFEGFELAEETRFGLMHRDEDCRYTNNTLGDAYHGSGEAVGHFDASTPINTATIAVPSTLGFPTSGTLTIYSTSDRSGSTSTVTYTGKTATSFTGCTLTAGASPANARSLYVAQIWVGSSGSSWGCNASRHHGRHYCAAGQLTALAVHCTDGQVIDPGTIFEGSDPKYDVHYDAGGLTTVNAFEQRGATHIENNPTGAAYKANCQGLLYLAGISYVGGGSSVVVDNSSSTDGQVVIADASELGATPFKTTASLPPTWMFLNCPVGNDYASASFWSGGVVPNITQLDSSILNLISLKAQVIYNQRTGNEILQFLSSDEVYVRGGGLAIYNTGTSAVVHELTNTGLGFFGHAPVVRPAAPVTLADVIAIIRGYGLSA